MEARNLRVRTARNPQRPPRQRRWGRGFRRGATLARRFLGVPVRVLRSPVRVLKFRRNIAGNPADAVPVVAQLPSTPHAQPAHAAMLTGEHTASRRVLFALVNLCTLTSVSLGMAAVLLAVRDQLQIGGLLLLGCVFFDGLDGALARAWKVSTPFGVQMDSLADMCSFGMATPVLAYFWLVGSNPVYVVVPACMLMGGCAAVRLARFNVSPKDGTFFSGVPTTVAAGMVVIFTLVLPDPMPVLPVIGVVLIALLMVSSFPYMKLQRCFGFPIWLWSVPAIVAYFSVAVAFGLVVMVYVLSGPVAWARQRRVVATAPLHTPTGII